MALPLKDGLIDWPEWHRQIVRDNLELAAAARNNMSQFKDDKYINDGGYVRYWERKALYYERIASRHTQDAKGYENV